MELSPQTSAPAKWYNYVAAFFSGYFFANFFPHFTHGVSGDRFPTPFSNPPGLGLSSPVINVLWGSFNLFLGYVLLRAGKVSPKNRLALVILFLGFLLTALAVGNWFVAKAKM